ncbi:MAG: endonuclease/exonuclease/phosphatase family protein [Campylobacterales bacterium]|nr:endonuclease/exonuclease/phosphatase family protein [Campylobacterales bacterium]
MIRLFLVWCVCGVLLFGVSLGTYNVENLFDATHQGSEYEEYIPGKFGWDEAMAKKKFDNTLSVIRALDVDILALQEVENEALMHALAHALSYPYSVFTKPSHSATGVGVLSRYPLGQSRALPLEGGRWREMLWVEVYINGEVLELVNVHWPSLRNPKEERLKAANVLKAFVQGRENSILLGDFNDPLGPESVLSQTLGRLEVREGWFDPWFTQKERWSHDFFGNKQALDRIILGQGLLRGEGLVLERGSFEVFSRFSTKHGSPLRWERRNKGKGVHVGKGYSDHFPLKLTLTTAPQLAPKPAESEALFNAKEGNVSLLLTGMTVMYVHDEGMVLGKDGRGIYVYKPGFVLELGEVVDVWVHALKTFQGMREIVALHVEKILPQKGDIYAHMLPKNAFEKARAGDVLREVEGVVKQGRLVSKEGSMRIYAKHKERLPKEGEHVRLERVRVGMYGGQKELMLEERK